LKILNHKKGKVAILLMFLLVLLGNIKLHNSINYDSNNNYNLRNKDTESDSRLKTANLDPKGSPLLITQHAIISNTYFPLSLPTNVSFTLLEGWTSKNVTINYDEVTHYKDWVINGTFDDGENPWEYESSNPSKIVKGDWQPEYASIEVNALQSLSKGDYGYFEENLTIPEISTSNTIASLSMNYKYDLPNPAPPSTTISAFISITIGGIEKNISVSFSNLVPNVANWNTISMTYDMSEVGQIIPENATLRVGVYVDDATSTPNRVQTLYIDDVQFTFWTKPNEPNLIIAKDVEFDQNYYYENSTFGRGETFIDVERSRTETSSVKFTISKNPVYIEDLYVYNITIMSDALKSLNSTVNGIESSEYTTSNQIIWQTECSFMIPYGYSNNWAKIMKPSDWNITSILDEYNSEQRDSCTGYDPGSGTLIIPQGVLSSGLWIIKALSQNYISEGSLNVYNGTVFEIKSSVTLGDTFQINVSLDGSVPYQNTFINCSIEYPNGSLFHQSSEQLTSHYIEFGSFIVGKNMPVGSYSVILLWTNNQSYVYRDKIGYLQFNFSLWHHTNLTPVEPFIERVSGEPLLIKLNYTDYDLDTYIDFATISYNSTLGFSGTMVYFGSGIYVADIDTSGVGIGEYYFSFNASKIFYENTTEVNLIQLNIIEQPLTLDFSSRVLNALSNNYSICVVTVNGEISKTPIPDANVSTDWDNGYSIFDYGNGTYRLNFSTSGLPIGGVIEAFEIEIFANKTGFGSVTDYITLIIHPISTLAYANTTNVVTYINEHFEVEVNYTDTSSGELISGGSCTVSWEGYYEINDVSDGFIITYYTTGLNIDVYNSLIRITKPGYEDALVSITTVINEQETNMSVSINSIDITQNSLVELFFKENINLTARIFAEPEGAYLSGGVLTILSDNYQNILVETQPTFFSLKFNINGENFSYGLNSIFLRYEKQNYTTSIFSFQFFIRAQEIFLDVKINDVSIPENYLQEVYTNQLISISCRAFAEDEMIYLTGGSIKFITEGDEFDLVEESNYWYNISIRISSDNFSLGINNVYVKFELSNYSTTTFSFQIYVRSQNIIMDVKINDVSIPENYLQEVYSNELISLSCRAFAEDEMIYLTGGNVKFITEGNEFSLVEDPIYWYNTSIRISSDNFSLGINYAYVKFELSNYSTTTFSFQIFVRSQDILLDVKVDDQNIAENYLLEAFYDESISISCRAFAEDEAIYLSGGIIKFTIGTNELNISETSNYWYNRTFKIAPNFFIVGINYAYIKFEHVNYSTIIFSFQFYIRTQNVVLEVNFDGNNIQENDLIENKYFNDLITLSCRGLAEKEAIYLSGATAKFIVNTQEFILPERDYYWYNESISILTNTFSLGINYVYVKFELTNYTTTTFSFQIQVNQIPIHVQRIDFTDSINVQSGDKIFILINLTEINSNIPIENATVYCYWEFGTYYFEYIDAGTYKLDLGSQTEIGTHRFNLVITPKQNIYKTTEDSFLIIITEKPTPNYILLITVIGLIAIVGILGTLSVRSYVILPRKRRKRQLIAEKTQGYKDIRNIEALIISSKISGMTLYSRTFSILDEDYITGFSGFIQAITILGKQYTKEGVKLESKDQLIETGNELKELDFNFFHSLICDHEQIRLILLLREKSSEQLRQEIEHLARDLYSECEDLIIGFIGNIKALKKPFEEVIDRHLAFYYKGSFTLNKNEKYHSLKLSGDLSNLELRVLNVLESQSKYNKQFYLNDLFTSLLQNVDEDSLIIAIESLIAYELIIPQSQRYSLYLD
jgi:hypothetical protein